MNRPGTGPRVALDGLFEAEGLHAVDASQVAAEHHFVAADKMIRHSMSSAGILTSLDDSSAIKLQNLAPGPTFC
jgi:hypothetical protein